MHLIKPSLIRSRDTKTPSKMHKHTTHSVTQVVKRKLRKLFTALADPIQSRKHALKPDEVSENDRIAQITPVSAAAVVDDAQEFRDTQLLDPDHEIYHVKVEETPQKLRDDHNPTETVLVRQLEGTQDASNDAAGVEADSKEEKQRQDVFLPLLHDHTSPILEEHQPRTLDSVNENPERTRADSGTIICSPGIAGAAKETSGNNGFDALNTGDVDSPKPLITIPLESDLAQQLKDAVLEHRRLNILEQDADLQLASLEEQAENLSQHIAGLEVLIMNRKASPESTEQSAEITVLYDAISNLRQAEDDAWQRRHRLTRHMSELYQRFRDEHCPLFDQLDLSLVSNGLIPPVAVTIPSYSSNSSAMTSKGQPFKPSYPLRRITATTVNQTKDSFGQAAAAARDRATLLDDFIAKRRILATCEERFDARFDLFDTLETSRARKLEAGRVLESITEFDHHIHDATRQLTRDFIDAETKYDAAKAAAVAAGIKLTFSDLESGFANDADDGYTVSMERDMVQDCNRKRIEVWLMDIEDKACPTRYLSVRESGEIGEMNGVDDWIGDEVELSDSRSLVAGGPSRKRIDRWRSQL